ncbi:MAG: hypothetical protein AB7G34_15100 [Hyphomicrobiales bacterium]
MQQRVLRSGDPYLFAPHFHIVNEQPYVRLAEGGITAREPVSHALREQRQLLWRDRCMGCGKLTFLRCYECRYAVDLRLELFNTVRKTGIGVQATRFDGVVEIVESLGEFALVALKGLQFGLCAFLGRYIARQELPQHRFKALGFEDAIRKGVEDDAVELGHGDG